MEKHATHFIQEKLWHDRGYLCMVVLTPMGHRCGYVGIHKGQPYYGVGYLALEWIDCHGGLAYSDDHHHAYTQESGNNPKWWIGFDCAHYNDIPDVKAVEAAYGADSEAAERARRMSAFSFDDFAQVRTLEFCVSECKKIVDQLIGGEEHG